MIHAREADDDVAAILASHPARRPRSCIPSAAVLALLRAGLVLRHYVSFSGMVTFKNWSLDEAIRETPLDRLLLETDGPYLAPVPLSRKAQRAGLRATGGGADRRSRGLPVDELIALTGANAARVFRTAVPEVGRRTAVSLLLSSAV